MSNPPDTKRTRTRAGLLDWIVQEASELSHALEAAENTGAARSTRANLRLSMHHLMRCADFVLEVSKAAEELPSRPHTPALPTYVVLDIAQLRSLAFLEADLEAGTLSLWREGIVLGFRLRREAEGLFALHIGAARSADRQVIAIDSTNPSFGGVRYWLLCPACHSRNMRLYRQTTEPGFQCRTCHKTGHDTGWRTARDRSVVAPVIQHQQRAS